MNIVENKNYVNETWENSIIPTLIDYIKIPNKSPLFDPDWEKNGYMEKAVSLITHWCHQQAVQNMKLEVIRLPGRTPLIFIEIPGESDDTIVLYGHLDKQPEMTGWDNDLGPWNPVLKGDKLYGRGGADDGYATFASLTAIKSLQTQHIPHARCVILIEACEESGSVDLPFYIDALNNRIGKPSLIICLDSGCGNYDQLWVTNSLRGIVTGTLHINVLKQGIHSGAGSGVAPSCFLVLRQLLNRIEDEKTGEILLKEFQVNIPTPRLKQVEQSAKLLRQDIDSYPFEIGTNTITDNLVELILNRTWRSKLSITGIEGLPSLENAGNVTIPWIKLKLSMRLGPTLDPLKATAALKNALEENPPFNAKVKFEPHVANAGWCAPEESPWLVKAANEASTHYFGANAAYMGEGGSIPFMAMLGEKFPEAQFLITGLLGPASNAHGPNEFLHIPTGKKLTACVAHVIANHFRRNHG